MSILIYFIEVCTTFRLVHAATSYFACYGNLFPKAPIKKRGFRVFTVIDDVITDKTLNFIHFDSPIMTKYGGHKKAMAIILRYHN